MLERVKAQAQWHEAEHHRAREQNNKLVRDAEAARDDAARLHTLLEKKDRAMADLQHKAATLAMEEKEAREREHADLRDALAQERGRAERLEQEKARLGYQLQAQARELAGVAHEAREAKQAMAEAEASARQLREERRLRNQDPGILGSEQLHQTTKSLQRAQHTRRALHGTLAHLQGALEQFRRHETLGDLNKRLVETTVAVDTSAVQVPAGWADLAQDVRKLLGNVAALVPRLLDEVEAGKRESEVLSTELEELLAKVHKATTTTSSSSSSGGGPHAAAASAGTIMPVERKLQIVEHVADETAHLLRGMARSHLQSVRGQLRTTEAQQSDLVLEAQECKRQAVQRATEASEALQARLRAEEEKTEAQTAMELALVQRDTLELTLAAQESQLQEQQQKLDAITHDVLLLREEGEHLRGALAQAHDDQARQEDSLRAQERALQHAATTLSETQEEKERLMDRVQEAEADVEATRFREADALQRLDAAAEEIQLYVARLADEEARGGRVEEGLMAHLAQLQATHQTTIVWHAWRHGTAAAKVAKLQQALDETNAQLTIALAHHQSAEAKWEAEVAAGDRLAEACAAALGRRRRDVKARAALHAWRVRARERTRARRDLHNYLKQFVLRRKVAAGHEVARLLEGRIQDFSRALEEAVVEKTTEREAAQLELAEARAQGLAKDGQLQRLGEDMETLRGQVAAGKGLEEQLLVRDGEVADLQATLVDLEDLKREMDAAEERVQEEEDEEGKGLEKEEGGGGKRCNTMTAYLMVRTRRAEREKQAMAQQLAEAREDVRRLSREVEEMVATMQWGGMQDESGGALSPAGEELRIHAQAVLTQQLERAHETLELLEGQLEETQQEANGMERQLVEALEDVTTLEEHLAAHMESAGLQQAELERLREASASREERVLSLSQRIGTLESEHKEAHTRFVEMLKGGEGGGGGGEAGGGGHQVLVEEVGRLQQALQVSEQDRVHLEQQLADVLREREELFELCHLLRNELQQAATATLGTRDADASFSSLPCQTTVYPQQQQQQQQQRETAAQSAQELHWAVQRSQERLDVLLQEGHQVTEGLAAAVGKKKGGGGGGGGGGRGHAHHHHHHHHHRRRDVDPPSSISSLSSGKEEERKQRKKSKKDKTKEKKESHHHHHKSHRHRHQQIEAEEEEEEEEEGMAQRDNKEEDEEARHELQALIQNTQEEVDAAAEGKRQSVNRALVHYLNSLKASLRCLEGREEAADQ